MRRTPLLGFLAGLALLTSACSGQTKDPTATQLREKIAKELRATPGSTLTTKQATCYAGLLVKQLGAKAINKIDLKDSSPDPATAKAIATAAIAAGSACGIGAGASASTTSTSTTSSTGATSSTSTTAPG